MVSWLPSELPSGNQSVSEVLAVFLNDGLPKITLSKAPVTTPVVVPVLGVNDVFLSRAENVVTLNGTFAAGDQMQASYEAAWPQQPDCTATISVFYADGSESGATASVTLTARDCRVGGDLDGDGIPDDEDPDDDGDGIPDEDDDSNAPPEDTSDDDPDEWPDLDDPDDDTVVPDPTSCADDQIMLRVPVRLTADNWPSIAGVSHSTDCPGRCSCSQICHAMERAGRLASNGMTLNRCLDGCAQTRGWMCDTCTLSGPTTLAPGAEGTWTDDKGNTGDPSGDLNLISRTAQEGYKFRMPTGGAGPFTVRVCYGAQQDQCCEAEVDYPPCGLTGPDTLAPGAEGEYTPGLGMTGATAAVNNMVVVRQTATSFVAKIADGACEGSITVSHGGRWCGSVSVHSTLENVTGVVSGPSTMEPGETAYFAWEIPGSDSASDGYEGTLEVMEMGVGGAVLRMPVGASGDYTAKWTASCGREASMTVTAIESGACTGGSCYTNILGTKSPGDVVCVCGQWVRLGATVLDDNLCWWTEVPVFWFAGGGRWVQCSASHAPWQSYTVL